MTTDYHFNDHSCLQFNDLPDKKEKHTNDLAGAMDMVKRDRFELLSAYLDGEVTAAERKQVEQLLANDADVQRLYDRLLKLRQGLRTMPLPQSQQPLEKTVQQVMGRLHRREQRAWVLGGTAIAATIIGAISGLVPGSKLTAPQLAIKPSVEQTQPNPEPIAVAPLMLAINNPIMAIPKAAETSPEHPVNQQKQFKLGDLENNYN
ncbi:zf-HC2 domain-containing protein [Chlorogloeopsis sp. ULAP01]|uniref:anti-sigma factor family protein n=1 Tax=Chlorogloeopsis sp. ULAP01 TaxID=3056483 RepID=UPI0025AA5771|nr:zf-HC2 domain-containing protein [Chlorogloeopsis sp. ULAP01]MDM9379502.1 zf-HC2 domain-containing protein [Chlorogloeopsis sp. ULAP01]